MTDENLDELDLADLVKNCTEGQHERILANRAQVSHTTIYRWKQGMHLGQIVAFFRVIRAAGYTVTLRKRGCTDATPVAPMQRKPLTLDE